MVRASSRAHHYTLQEDVAKYDELFQQERKLG